MKLPLLIASSAKESAVVRLFSGDWFIKTFCSSGSITTDSLTSSTDETGSKVTGPCNVQVKRETDHPITVYAEKL